MHMTTIKVTNLQLPHSASGSNAVMLNRSASVDSPG